MACLVVTAWTLEPGSCEVPVLLVAPSDLQWLARVPRGAAVHPGAPGVGTWQMVKSPPCSCPCHTRTYQMWLLDDCPMGPTPVFCPVNLGPPRSWRNALGTGASLSCRCCYSPGLTARNRSGYPSSSLASAQPLRFTLDS